MTFFIKMQSEVGISIIGSFEKLSSEYFNAIGFFFRFSKALNRKELNRYVTAQISLESSLFVDL